MKCLSIQIKPESQDDIRVKEVIALSRRIGRYPEIDKGEDEGIYVNLNYFTEDLTRLWSELRGGLLNHDNHGSWLRRSTIIVCEGDSSWDDYLLLHHFDQSEKLDEL